MSSQSKQLVITLTLSVQDAEKDREGIEELYLRCMSDKVMDVLDVSGRGKFHVDRKIEFKKLKKKKDK